MGKVCFIKQKLLSIGVYEIKHRHCAEIQRVTRQACYRGILYQKMEQAVELRIRQTVRKSCWKKSKKSVLNASGSKR